MNHLLPILIWGSITAALAFGQEIRLIDGVEEVADRGSGRLDPTVGLYELEHIQSLQRGDLDTFSRWLDDIDRQRLIDRRTAESDNSVMAVESPLLESGRRIPLITPTEDRLRDGISATTQSVECEAE